MSAPTQRNAEQKFWQNPELVEGFLRFLDPAATLQLALAHKKTRSILQGSWAWKCLVKRNSPLAEQDVDHLVAIMKLKKDARNHILDNHRNMRDSIPTYACRQFELKCTTTRPRSRFL